MPAALAHTLSSVEKKCAFFVQKEFAWKYSPLAWWENKVQYKFWPSFLRLVVIDWLATPAKILLEAE